MPTSPSSRLSFTYCLEYYEAAAARDCDFFTERRSDRVIVGNDCWIGHAITKQNARSGPGIFSSSGCRAQYSGKRCG
jgi:hypothetical protein